MQLQLATYVRDPGGYRAAVYGIMVLTIDGSTHRGDHRLRRPGRVLLFGLSGYLEA